MNRRGLFGTMFLVFVALVIPLSPVIFASPAEAKRPRARAPKILRDTIVSFVASRELRVVNPKPVEIGYRKWTYGNVCTAEVGAEMQVLGTGGGKVLLLYIPTAEESTINCPRGVLFLMSTRDFLRQKTLDDKRKAAERAERELILKILGIEQSKGGKK